MRLPREARRKRSFFDDFLVNDSLVYVFVVQILRWFVSISVLYDKIFQYRFNSRAVHSFTNVVRVVLLTL